MSKPTDTDLLDALDQQMAASQAMGIDDAGFRQRYLKEREAHDRTRAQLLLATAGERDTEEPLDILVVGDAHSDPAHSNRRFTWLGRFIADRQPDVVVIMGDFASMGSLSKYDKGKLSGEGQRYEDDVSQCKDALQRIEQEAAGVPYHKYVTLGNHEDRIWRWVNDRPEVAGTLSWENLGFEQQGWTVAPFLEPLDLQGVRFQHYFMQGGRPINAKYTAANLLDKFHRSSVCAHSHLYQHHDSGSGIFGLVGGCYFEHDEPYAKTDNSRWWRGLVMLKGVHSGYHHGGIELLPIDEVRSRYG